MKCIKIPLKSHESLMKIGSKTTQEKHKQLPLQGLAEAARNVTIHQAGRA